jgi:hypothetical protein
MVVGLFVRAVVPRRIGIENAVLVGWRRVTPPDAALAAVAARCALVLALPVALCAPLFGALCPTSLAMVRLSTPSTFAACRWLMPPSTSLTGRGDAREIFFSETRAILCLFLLLSLIP